MKKYAKKFQEQLENTLKDFLAVIGLFLDVVQKRSGTAPAVADPMDLGIELQRRCWELPENWSPNLSMHQRL